jgi:RNA polymerase sigma-70 factor (ECF subfamily)
MNAAGSDEQDARDMRRLAGGDDAALNELMERHAEKVFHYLLRSLQNESDAEDLAQETFARVYHQRAKFDGRLKFSTWLYAIASNLVRDRYRWRARHPQVPLDAGGEQFPDGNSTPGQSLQVEERAEAVRSAIAALPEDLRLPLVLVEYQEKSHAEVAGILNCTVKAVENRVYRARKQLRVTLERLLEHA